MNELELNRLIQRCPQLKYKFRGVFAADNYPKLSKKDSFVIVNASRASNSGSHWLLVCNRQGTIVFADPLGFSLAMYPIVYARFRQQYNGGYQDIMDRDHATGGRRRDSGGGGIQNLDSIMCGAFCIYMAHCLFRDKFPRKISENALQRFVKHMY